MSVLTAGSTVLPDPAYQGYSTVAQELTKADRNTLGNLIKERITIKVTISAEWKGLTKAEKDAVMSSTSGNTFSLSYFNLDDDSTATGTFYRGSDYEVAGYGKFNGNCFQYYDVKLSFIEV